MKKSKAITLVLVTGLLGCNRNADHNRLYLRTDSTGSYTPAATGYYGYYVFRPYGTYYGGYYGGRSGYVREGYSNAGVRSSGNISRGGFGSTGGFHASSSS